MLSPLPCSFSFILLPLTPPIILSLSLFLLPFIIRLLLPPIFIHHPPFLLSISVCLSLSLHLFLSLPLPYFLSLFTPLLPLLMWLPFSHLHNITSSPLLSFCLPTMLFSRPHSHVDLFRGGPRRDWRGGGCHRLHPALPPHRPRQIPHQTQRSTAHTLTHTDMHGCAHACMHERTPRYTCINMDTCVPRQALTPTSMHMQGHTARNS